MRHLNATPLLRQPTFTACTHPNPLLPFLAMARKHADRVDAAIKALALDSKRNLNATQIWRLLSAGEAGLDKPIEMPKRTVQHKVAAFRREFSYDVDPLRDADETEVADSIIRDYLRMGLLEAKRYKALQKAGKVGAKETQHMRENAKLISECQRHFKRQRGPASTRQAASASQHGRNVKPASTLERLASQFDPASPNPSDSNGSGNAKPEAEGSDEGTEEADQHSVSLASSLLPVVHA